MILANRYSVLINIFTQRINFFRIGVEDEDEGDQQWVPLPSTALHSAHGVCSVSLSRLRTVSWCTHHGRPLNFSQQPGGYFVCNLGENPLTAVENMEWLMETLTFCPGLPISPWQQEDTEEEEQGQQSLNVLPKSIFQSRASGQTNPFMKQKNEQIRKFNSAGWDKPLTFSPLGPFIPGNPGGPLKT